MANKGNSGRLAALLFWEHYGALTRVRRAHKGLKYAYLWSVGVVGMQEGLRLYELVKITGVARHVLYERLKRVRDAGYIRCDDLRYYLSNAGKEAFNALNAEIGAGLDRIADEVLKEVKSRL